PVGRVGDSGAFRQVRGRGVFSPTQGNNGVALAVPYYLVPRARSLVGAQLLESGRGRTVNVSTRSPPLLPWVGLNTTRPCTCRKALESPTVPTGTARCTATVRLAWPPIVIELAESVAVCAAPAPCTTESAKLAGASPRFSTTMDAWPLKSRVSSATPKLKLGVPSPACAITVVCVAPTGCTKPLPSRRAE